MTPASQPVGEQTDATAIVCGDTALLIGGRESTALRAAVPIGSATIYAAPNVLFYGFAQVTSGAAHFPAEALDDRGARYSGLQAVDWVKRRGQRFPRADVIGWTSDGVYRELMMRDLDLALPVQLFCANDAADFPGRRLTQIVTVSDYDGQTPDGIPERARNYFPVIHRSLAEIEEMIEEYCVG